jgi:hypothetical protein
MSVKLRQLAEMDLEYAKELEAFFKEDGITDYLDMTIDDFVKFCEGKLGEYSKQIMGAMQKREHQI